MKSSASGSGNEEQQLNHFKKSDASLFSEFDNVIHQIASKYVNGAEGIDFQDLLQEGRIGLLSAIRDYDPGKNPAFDPFARLCIERQIQKAVEKQNRKKQRPLNTYVSIDEPENGGGDDDRPISETLGSSDHNPEQLLVERERVEDWRRKIDERLSPLEKQVLSCYLKGYGPGETASLLKRTTKSVDNAMQRIRKKLLESGF